MTGAEEGALRSRFDVREERFEHGAFRVELILPRAADALIDEAEFAGDERLPYWAELWPSARALARHLLDAGPDDAPVLELGCGVALPSLALRSRGVPVLATDWYDDALRFARVNAERNALGPLDARPLDWRHPPPGIRFGRIIAADVAYEARNAPLLAALLDRVAATPAVVLLADPGRVHAPELLALLGAGGWSVERVDERREPSAEGAFSTVGIWRIAR
jgi:ETFB lysine methyltransferase